MRGTPTILLLAAVAIGGCRTNVKTNIGVPLASRSDHTVWRGRHFSGEIITSRHYRIHTTVKRAELLRSLPGFMEAAHRNYLAMTHLDDTSADGPLPVYMMATRAEWALLTEEVLGFNKDAALSIAAGGYHYKGVCVFWDIGGANVYSVAAHEGLHQFLNQRLIDPLPMWLEEGLCVSSEGHRIRQQHVQFTPDKNPFRFSALRTGIIQGYWLNIADLLPMDATDVVTKGTRKSVSYYGQLWAISMFIRSHPIYAQGLRRLLADAEAGRVAQVLKIDPEVMAELKHRGRAYNRLLSEPVFCHYITDDLDGFNREALAFARRYVGLR